MKIYIKEITNSTWLLNDYEEDNGTFKFHCSHDENELVDDEDSLYVECLDQDCQGIDEHDQEILINNSDLDYHYTGLWDDRYQD